MPASSGSVTITEIPFTPRAKHVLELSVDEAKILGHNYVGTEHLLLGLIREGDGIAARVLLEFGADKKKVRDETLRLLGGSPRTHKGAKHEAKTETPALDQFGRDLTELARQGKLDPVIGREVEIERVVQVLCRRKKNNPVLIGEPGVGKTAIVESLATKIVENKVPEILRSMRVVALDLAAIVAGTKYRGQFEERLKSIINEIREAHNVIVFIDELAHDSGRRRGGGRDRRLQHAQAGPGPRRAAVHRRDHPGRVPQVHREGRRSRAQVPADNGRLRRRWRRRSRSSRACGTSTRPTTG